MQKTIGVVLASVVLATSAITTASAAPRYDRQDRVIHNYCQNNWDNDCRDWERDRDRWDEARYHRWYRDHHRDRSFGPDDAAAAIFGFAAGAAAGAITGSINGAANGSHIARCDEAYRSYDPASDTYMGHDGYRHECRL